MKLERITIENFRAIRHLEIGFADELDRIRSTTVIAGPNASGKTTVLDAISAALCPLTRICWPRDGFTWDSYSIVRRGAMQARVECVVRFSGDELEVLRRLLRLAGESRPVPGAQKVTVKWEYPFLGRPEDAPEGGYRYGFVEMKPGSAWVDFMARSYVRRLLHAPEMSLASFRDAGGIFTFDQVRTGVGKRIPTEIRAAIGMAPENGEGDNGYTDDPRHLLLALAFRAQARQADEQEDFRQDYEGLCAAFERICAPHRVVGPVTAEAGRVDMEFSGDGIAYRYDELSSGQKMVLLFLLRMVGEHVHRSIVLIDELELHLHPAWQQRLLGALPHMGTDNQFIVTTHSAYVRDMTPRDGLVSVGDLGDAARRPGGDE